MPQFSAPPLIPTRNMPHNCTRGEDIQLYEAGTYASPLKSTRYISLTGTKFTRQFLQHKRVEDKRLTDFSLFTKDHKLNWDFLTHIWALTLHLPKKYPILKHLLHSPFPSTQLLVKQIVLPFSADFLFQAFSIKSNSLPRSFSNESTDGKF